MPLLSSDFVVAPGETILLTNPDAGTWGYEVLPGNVVNFTNNGSVIVIGDTNADELINASVIGFYQPFGAGANSLFWNRAGAQFHVTAIGFDGDAIGVRGTGQFPANVRNNGVIEVVGDRGAFGVLGVATFFENAGSR
jgi:hypothetical protein